MARMGDIEREALEALGWFHRDTHATHTPAQTPVNLETQPHQGETMSLLDGAKTALAEAEATLEGVDETAVSALKAINANPGGKAVFDTLAGVLHVEPSFLQIAANTLADLGSMFPKPAQPESVAAGQ